MVVDINSAVAHLSLAPDFSSYAVAKAATWRFWAAFQLENLEVCAYSLQPGTVPTSMAKESGIPARDDGKGLRADSYLVELQFLAREYHRLAY